MSSLWVAENPEVGQVHPAYIEVKSVCWRIERERHTNRRQDQREIERDTVKKKKKKKRPTKGTAISSLKT